MNISYEWFFGSLGSLAVSAFGAGYLFCIKQKDPTIETKEFDCEIVHNEWVLSMTYSGYPIVLQGFKKAKASLRDGVPYWVECRHFRADEMICGYTSEPCLLKHQLQNTQPKRKSILSKMLQRK